MTKPFLLCVVTFAFMFDIWFSIWTTEYITPVHISTQEYVAEYKTIKLEQQNFRTCNWLLVKKISIIFKST